MMNRRRGFLIYLAFVVTTVLLLLTLHGHDVARFALDSSRSGALDVVGFHAADGGLEQGLARLRTSFQPFRFSYSFKPASFREVRVEVTASPAPEQTIDLLAAATVFDGGKHVAMRRLTRRGVQNATHRQGSGTFAEVL